MNREFAQRLFHSEDVVGRYFKNSSGVQIQIVGVVADGKYLFLGESQKAAVFFPVTQRPTTKTSLVVRVRPDFSDEATNAMAGTVRKVVLILIPPCLSGSRVPGGSSLG